MQHAREPRPSRLRFELTPLRGLWPDIGTDLQKLGVTCLADLRGRDPDTLLNAYRGGGGGNPDDPILRFVFMSIVNFAKTGIPTPWWQILRADTARTLDACHAP